MADNSDFGGSGGEQLQLQLRAAAKATVLGAFQRLLKRAPTGGELSNYIERMVGEGRSAGEIGLLIAGDFQREIASGKQQRPAGAPPHDPKKDAPLPQFQAGLSDEKQREEFRKSLREFGAQGESPESGIHQRANLLTGLEKVPVSFLDPTLTVSREEVDTPDEASRFLQKHGGDTQLNRRLLEAAINYGGLSIEPTPFGTQSAPGGGTEWYRPDEGPGEIEQQLEAKYARGGTPSPAELSAVAQERQGAFRLRQKNPELDLATKAILAGIFSYAGGAIAGPLVGGITGSTIAGGAAAGATGGGIAGGIGGRGDPDAVWKSAVLGGLTGGLGAGLPSPSGPAMGAARGAGISGATNLAGQGLSGDDFDWQKFVQALATGGATGAAAGTTGNFPGSELLTKLTAGTGSALLNSAGQDPLAGVNARMDQNQLDAERSRAAQMQAAQEEWKRRYGEASAAAQAAQMEEARAAQQEWEGQKAEYEAKLQAFLAERQTQIEEALRAMGMAEPGIAGLIADRQKQLAAAQAEEESQRASLVESRNFFPSELLAQTGETGAPVMFGQEGMPTSFTNYSQTPTPQFSGEGFLPSGAPPAPPPSVAPMGPRPQSPRYFPTLLNGLTRSPYLRYA